jgi:hypothetical protein
VEATSAVVEELQSRERELDSRKGTIITWEDGLTVSKHALGRVCMEHDVECAQTEAVRQNYLTRSRALTSNSKHSINFNWMLEEHQILLSLQRKDLKM